MKEEGPHFASNFEGEGFHCRVSKAAIRVTPLLPLHNDKIFAITSPRATRDLEHSHI